MSGEVPSRQEMFNRAVRGLRAQGWRRALGPGGLRCVYQAGNGDRCAWGHVDASLGLFHSGTVYGLKERGEGLAGRLSMTNVEWACELQRCHDRSSFDTVENRFRAFGEKHGLEWPADEAGAP